MSLMSVRLANDKTAADFNRNNWIIRQRCGKGIGLGMAESYTISLPDGIGKPGTMTSSVHLGEVTGDKIYKGSGIEKYTLTPIEPCK